MTLPVSSKLCYVSESHQHKLINEKSLYTRRSFHFFIQSSWSSQRPSLLSGMQRSLLSSSVLTVLRAVAAAVILLLGAMGILKERMVSRSNLLWNGKGLWQAVERRYGWYKSVVLEGEEESCGQTLVWYAIVCGSYRSRDFQMTDYGQSVFKSTVDVESQYSLYSYHPYSRSSNCLAHHHICTSIVFHVL